MVGARLASALLHFGTEAHRYDCRSEKVDMSQEPRYVAMTAESEKADMSQELRCIAMTAKAGKADMSQEQRRVAMTAEADNADMSQAATDIERQIDA